MTAECFLAVVIICGIYMVCELAGRAIHYKIPALVIFMAALIILGGQLGLLPDDLFETAGFSNMVYTFGLPFVLAGFGTTMSVSSIKGEAMTVAIALITIVCIVGLGLSVGLLFMDLRTSLYGAVEVAGGGQAGLIFLTHLQELGGNERMIALMLCLMNMQCLFGLPLSIILMRKSMIWRIDHQKLPQLTAGAGQVKENKTPIRIPEDIRNNIYYVFLMLGLICFLSAKLNTLTTLSAYLWYILLGFLFAELGLLEHNCLVKCGAAPLMFSIMFIVVCEANLTMNLGDVVAVAVDFVILIGFGIIGSAISGLIAKKLFKIDFCEGFCIAIGCMVGYPISQTVAVEALKGVKMERQITDAEEQCLQLYYEPKIIISGVVTISLVTGLMAGIIVSFL